MSINVTLLVGEFGKRYIHHTGNQNHFIFADSLYWIFRDFIYKNVIIPNKIQIESGQWHKEKIIKLFAAIIFKTPPTFFELQKKNGWNGWEIDDFRRRKKNKRYSQINIIALADKFAKQFIRETGRAEDYIDADELWKTFKDWWIDETDRDYFPSKKKIIDYIEYQYFGTENERWRGFKLILS